MSKEKSIAKAEEPVKVNIINEKAIITDEQGKLLLAKLKGKKEVSITADYLEMEEGEVITAIIVGFHEIPALPPKEGKVPAVKLMVDNGEGEPEFKVTAASMLVTNLMSLPIMTPVTIKYLGEKSGKTYKYQNYQISVLTDEV